MIFFRFFPRFFFGILARSFFHLSSHLPSPILQFLWYQAQVPGLLELKNMEPQLTNQTASSQVHDHDAKAAANSQHLSHCCSKGSTWDSHLSYIGSIGGKASVSNLYPHQPGQSGTDEPFAALTHYYSCCRCFFCSSSGCCVKDREQAASVASRRRQAAVRWRGGR